MIARLFVAIGSLLLTCALRSAPSTAVNAPPVTMSTDQMTSMNPGFAQCDASPATPACWGASASLLLTMKYNQDKMASNLESVKSSMATVQTQQTEANASIAAIQTALFGSDSYDTNSVLVKVNKANGAIEAVQSSIQSQAVDVAAAVTKVVAGVNSDLENINKVMDSQMKQLQNDTAAVLAANTAAQQAHINRLNAGFAREKGSVVSQVSTNAATVTAAAKIVLNDAEGLEETANTELGAVKATLSDAQSSADAVQQYAQNAVGNATYTMNNAIKTGIQGALDDADELIDKTASKANETINKAAISLEEALTGNVSELAKQAEDLQANLQNNISDAQSKVLSLEGTVKQSVTSYSTTGSQLVNNLNSTVTRTGYDLSNVLNDAEKMENTGSELLTSVGEEAGAAISGAQAGMQGSIDAANNQVGGSVGSVFGQVGGELGRLNSDVASASENAVTQGNKLKENADSMINGVSGDVAGDTESQAGAVGDTAAAVDSANSMLNAMIDSKSDQLSSQFRGLAATVMGALNDATETAGEMGSAGQAQVSRVQSNVNGLVNSQSAEFANQIAAQKNAQAASIAALQGSLAGKGSDSASDLQAIKQAAFALSQSESNSENGAGGLNDLLSDSAASSSQEANELANLLAISGSATSAAAAQAGQQVGSEIGAMGDSLKSSLQGYASQFQNLFGGRMSGVQDQISTLVGALQGSSTAQIGLAADAKGQLNNILTDLGNIQGPAQGQYSSLVAMFQSQSQESEMKRHKHLAKMQAAADQSLEDLKNTLAQSVDSQTGQLSGNLVGLFATVQDKISSLMAALQSQGQTVASMESKASYDAANAEAWSTWYESQINAEQEKIRSTSGEQIGKLVDLQGLVSNWSSAIDLNITNAKAELLSALGAIPQVTADKVNATQSDLAANKAVMQEYIKKLQTAFEKQRLAEAAYTEQQSLLRLSAIMDVDSAVLATKLGVMGKTQGQGLSNTELARQTAAVLEALADAVQASSNKDGSLMRNVQQQITNLTANSAGLTQFFQSNINKQFSDVYVAQQQAQANMSAMIAAEASRTGNFSQALAGQLSSVIDSLHNKSIMASLALAEDKKNIFSQSGGLRSIADSVQLQLIQLLHEVQRQVDQANRVSNLMARSGIGKLSTVSGLMDDFGAVIGGYLENSRADFDGIMKSLSSFSAGLTSRMNISESYVISTASEAQEASVSAAASQQALTARMQSFTSSPQKQLTDLEE